MLKQKLVVVGNGMAGARAVEEVLARGGTDMFEITMFGAEPYGNYNRILLSNILCGIQDASEIYINTLEWYEENGITLHAGSPVVEIDRNSKKVKTESGIVAAYDVLLIATGSRAFIPPIHGLNKPDGTMKDGIYGFRTIDDCDGIIATAKTSKRAAVIGGGLLGLEAARGLLNHGCEVHLVHLGGHLMEAQLDRPAGAMLLKAMEKMGVTIHLERNTAEILGNDRITGLHFKTGETLECDMVVVAAGIRPNSEIGRSAGLTVERAIVVDNNMRSVDDMNVYVVGECAQHRGKVYGLVAPLWDQAKVFADHVTHTNRDAAYHGSKLSTKLKVMGVDEMPATAQVCNCNGVTKAAIGACVEAGKRTPKAVMQATRAGMGCGSCKGLVGEVVSWFCGGDVEEDVSIHYYVPCIPLAKPELVKAVRELELKSVSAVFKALAVDGREDAPSKPALASLLSTLWNDEYEDERDARFINDRVHGNIQKDGTFSVVPEMAGGITTPGDLMRIAQVAVKYNVPLVKLTGGQRIDLVGIPKQDMPAVWADLGMPAGWAWGKSYRTCKSCIGTEFCRFGLGDSMGLAVKIEAKFRGIDSPGKLKLATAGCPRNCSEAMVKDVGAVAIGEDRWEIYVGGAAGSHIRKGDVLCTVTGEDAAMRMTGRFIQWYRENAKYKERTHTFLERMGIERVRAVVVDDSEGIAAELDAAIDASTAAAVKDPWLERDAPKTANQFAAPIPVEA
jgi:NAD(P)H-nitrite reductase large subunit